MTNPVEDPFGDPQSNFISSRDFVGRLVIIVPTGVQHDIPSTMPNAKPGDKYNRVLADVHVLDGPVTDTFDTIPMVIKDQYLQGSALVPQISRPCGEGRIKPGGMVVGRVTTRKGKFPTPAVVLDPCPVGTPDRVKAKAYWDEYAVNVDPFAG